MLSTFLAFFSFGILAKSLNFKDFGFYILLISLATLAADLIDFGSGLHIIIASRNLDGAASRRILRRNLEIKISFMLCLLPAVLILSIIFRNYYISLCYIMSVLFFLRNNCLTTCRALDKTQTYGSIILFERVIFLLFVFFIPGNLITFLLVQIFSLGMSIFSAQRKGITTLCKPTGPKAILSNFRKSVQLGLGSALSNVNLIFPILIGALFGFTVLAEYGLLVKTLLPLQIVGSSFAMLRVKYDLPKYLGYSKRPLIQLSQFLVLGLMLLGLMYLLPMIISLFTDSRYIYSHLQIALVILIVLCQQLLSYITAGLQTLQRFNFINSTLLLFILCYTTSLYFFSFIQNLNTILLIELCLTAILTFAYVFYSRGRLNA